MNLENLTQKSQAALQSAQNRALRDGHAEVDDEHLLLALVEQSDGLVPRLLERMGVRTPELAQALDEELGRRPRVSGRGTEPGRIYITQGLQNLLLKAEDEAGRLKDDYISVEHLMLALADDSNHSAANAILRRFDHHA